MIRRTPRTRRGAALLEFALVFPLVLTFLLAFLELGWIFHHQQVVARAVREGCREGALTPVVGDPAVTAADAISRWLTETGYACGGDCSPVVETLADGDERLLACQLTVPLGHLTGAIPGLQGLVLTSATRTRVEWKE